VVDVRDDRDVSQMVCALTVVAGRHDIPGYRSVRGASIYALRWVIG
jgi:hypothetical protein